ncbi:hypothetical protein SLEP1_g45703 [Rubroshorea leprosula]|uniref:Uncharacterized protein n=1 Tax=Rubroshorea leprosula TaxID=152421 RepID=A0AAV5LKM1_9ROSI|nr:hypothetical protein SLEP1_g45703 [Rubroshorea leprosula]
MEKLRDSMVQDPSASSLPRIKMEDPLVLSSYCIMTKSSWKAGTNLSFLYTSG